MFLKHIYEKMLISRIIMNLQLEIFEIEIQDEKFFVIEKIQKLILLLKIELWIEIFQN
jgi:hypothetical protein